MKIRNSFVTNSSSSSFIIAVKKDANYDRFKEYVKDSYYENKEELLKLLKEEIEEGCYEKEEYLEENADYYGEGELISAYFENKDNIDKEYIDFIANSFWNLFDDSWNNTSELDSWKVTSYEATNEDDDTFSHLMYNDPTLFKNKILRIIRGN